MNPWASIETKGASLVICTRLYVWCFEKVDVLNPYTDYYQAYSGVMCQVRSSQVKSRHTRLDCGHRRFFILLATRSKVRIKTYGCAKVTPPHQKRAKGDAAVLQRDPKANVADLFIMFALSLDMVRFVLILQRDLEINGTSKQMFILDWMDFYMLLGGKAAHRISNVEPISYLWGY